ncbi:type II toxin-antitoxin system RelE/ParE family toxin [Vitreimonas sp.]|jgi:plasmid stabilization system protein ParE|uniref:type II toxin-antitoxin system RelE/ParE family toxin n=1 Tax=Vitreimonas sp. TaxID=3069702 RepID=UPI002ED84594
MRRVELRPAARRDLLRFERDLNRHSPRAALRMFDLVTRRILSLGAEPFKGVERRTDMRELFVKFGKSAYVVRYRVTDDAVIVTRVWNSRQNRPG